MNQRASSSESVAIEVWLDRSPEYKTVVTGARDAKFLDSLSLVCGPHVLDGAMVKLADYGADPDGWDLLLIDRDVTLASVSMIFEGKPVLVIFGGIGGDGGWPWAEWPLTLWEVANFALSVGGLVGAARSGARWVNDIRHGDKRRAAEAWRDSPNLEVIPMELRQHVLSKDLWYRQHFDDVFQLEPSTGTRLLRALGYEKTEHDGYPAWVEVQKDATSFHIDT